MVALEETCLSGDISQHFFLILFQEIKEFTFEV